MSDGGRLIFVGDVHLDHDDPTVERFLAFLDRLGATTARLVLMGDLFNLWLGRRELEQSHQRAVAEKLEALRRRGLIVRYVEGNRDYRVADCYTGRAFDDVAEEGLEERFAGHRIFAVLGDLVNRSDRQYRTWRGLSRSAPVWGLFNTMPRGLRRRIAESLEARMRSTNLDFKREFPEAAIRDHARDSFRLGFDTVVLGHFHVERELAVEGAGGRRIFVLPLWSESPRHLEFRADGAVGFVDS